MTDEVEQIASSIEDAYATSYSKDDPGASSYSTSATIAYLGHNGNKSYRNAYRFQNVNVPAGSTITGAHIAVKASSNTQGSTAPALKITANDVDDAAQWLSGNSIWQGTRTTANVTWTPGAWTIDNWYESSDIKDVIQEVIDRAGWVANNHIVVYIDDTANDNNAWRVCRTWDSGAANAAILTVHYTPPAGATRELAGTATGRATVSTGRLSTLQAAAAVLVSGVASTTGNLVDRLAMMALAHGVAVTTGATVLSIAARGAAGGIANGAGAAVNSVAMRAKAVGRSATKGANLEGASGAVAVRSYGGGHVALSQHNRMAVLR